MELPLDSVERPLRGLEQLHVISADEQAVKLRLMICSGEIPVVTFGCVLIKPALPQRLGGISLPPVKAQQPAQKGRPRCSAGMLAGYYLF